MKFTFGKEKLRSGKSTVFGEHHGGDTTREIDVFVEGSRSKVAIAFRYADEPVENSVVWTVGKWSTSESSMYVGGVPLKSTRASNVEAEITKLLNDYFGRVKKVAKMLEQQSAAAAPKPRSRKPVLKAKGNPIPYYVKGEQVEVLIGTEWRVGTITKIATDYLEISADWRLGDFIVVDGEEKVKAFLLETVRKTGTVPFN